MKDAQKSYTYEEIKQKLVNYCVYQDRCQMEVEIKMREFLLIPEARDEIFMYLIQENYLNEERYVRSYIRGKFYQKKWGRVKIRLNLKQKNISEKLIQKCFDEIDDDDYFDVLKVQWCTYFDKLGMMNEYEKKMKTTKYLLSRGFEYEEILRVQKNM